MKSFEKDLSSILLCVDCKADMKLGNEGWKCLSCGRVYEKLNSVILAWAKDIGLEEKEEAAYHDEQTDAIEIHQLHSWRNLFYHHQVRRLLQSKLPAGLLLEIGAGSGFDAAGMRDSSYDIILTDISPHALDRASRSTGGSIAYIAADGRNLPFRSNTFDGVYMIATLHHFRDPDLAIEEVRRVLKTGGVVVVGIEPNKLYFRYIKKFRHGLCRLTHTEPESGSRSDAEMIGFSHSDWNELFTRQNWDNVQIYPIWLFAGWLHYSLEFLYRALRLKKRIVLPVWVERGIVNADEFLFRTRLFRYLCWHWTVEARKLT